VTTSGNFRAIAGSSLTDMWAVGDGGAVWQSDGSPWAQRSSGLLANLESVFASDAQHAWAVGQGGALLVWNGSFFAPTSIGGSTPALNGVWASGANNVFVVGNNGFIARYDGSNWLSQTSSTSQNLRAVFGVSATRAYAVGDSGAVLTYDGTSWSAVGGATVNLRAVWAQSATEIYAAGDSGKVYRSTGGAFTEMTPGPATTSSIGGIFGTGAGDFWITADNMLFHYAGGAFSSVTPTPAVSGLRGIFGTGPTELYAVGAAGALLRYNGSWSPVTTGAVANLAGVTIGQRKLFVVGNGGTVLRQEL
jgi:photosystem II stability/assembly factor-like uncharacterized protein